MVDFCREGRGALTITLHVQPRAKKTAIVGVLGDALKVKVAAPPVDGAANEELTAFFSDFLGVPRSRLAIRHGAGSRHKVLEARGVTSAELVDLLLKNGLLTVSLG